MLERIRQLIERVREARRDDEAGFTLIELLIVIVILGVLAGIVVFSVQGIQDRGQTSACKADVATVQTAEEAFFAAQTGPNPAYATGAGFVQTLIDNNYLHSTPKETMTVDANGVVTGACPGGIYKVGG
jgi:general secretion pathway protein G